MIKLELDHAQQNEFGVGF